MAAAEDGAWSLKYSTKTAGTVEGVCLALLISWCLFFKSFNCAACYGQGGGSHSFRETCHQWDNRRLWFFSPAAGHTLHVQYLPQWQRSVCWHAVVIPDHRRCLTHIQSDSKHVLSAMIMKISRYYWSELSPNLSASFRDTPDQTALFRHGFLSLPLQPTSQSRLLLCAALRRPWTQSMRGCTHRAHSTVTHKITTLVVW